MGERPRAIIVGAGPAGLATSACLRRAGVPHLLVERAPEVGSAWRAHYDRLHLHTHKGGSGLPYLPFGDDVPRYPSRAQVVQYLERYVEALGLAPRLGETVVSVRAVPDGGWLVQTDRASTIVPSVVVCSGLTRVPHLPSWPGQERYRGEIVHSARYKNGAAWKGRRVLVVGFGNSAGEIALDLIEHGAAATLSVRGAVNVIPREILGIPIVGVGALLRALPLGVQDALGAPLVRMTIGDLGKLGLRKLPYGPARQVAEHGTVPLIDVGTIGAIRAGRIDVRRGIERYTETGVVFEEGGEESFDAVVAATGYRPALGDFLDATDELCPGGVPPRSGEAVRPGLYFCGFHVSPRGMLRQIGLDAQRIARAISS